MLSVTAFFTPQAGVLTVLGDGLDNTIAVSRDAVQSMCVPLLLHAPWLLASALLPALSEIDRFTMRMVLARSAVMVGDAFIWLWVGAWAGHASRGRAEPEGAPSERPH